MYNNWHYVVALGGHSRSKQRVQGTMRAVFIQILLRLWRRIRLTGDSKLPREMSESPVQSGTPAGGE